MAVLCLNCIDITAQIVTTSPAIVQQSSRNIVLRYNAASPLGNNGLKGLSQNDEVYAHIGLISSASANSGDWKYAPSKWGDNDPKYKLTNIGTDLWELNIGSFDTYFGLTPGESVRQIAVVFRSGDCSREGKTASGSDILIGVEDDGFRMQMESSLPNRVITDSDRDLTLTVRTTSPANIQIDLNGEVKSTMAESTELIYRYHFDSHGSYRFTATATADGETRTETVNFVYTATSPQENFPSGNPVMGTTVNPDGSVTFCLAAPAKNSVILVGSWDNYQILDKNIMKYHEVDGVRYFWTKVRDLDPDMEYPYYFVVDGIYNVGDPYAKLVLDPYSDKWINDGVYPDMIPYPSEYVDGTMLAVYKGNRDKYDWQIKNFKAPEAKDLIIYEMLLRDFTGTEGEANANGTLRQAMEKIPYLVDLGINAIELMPIMEFEGNNSWGYNPNFYMAPDKAYGTPDEYREFIDLCHANGIAVILDIVLNQSAGLHPWYQMYPVGSNPFYNAKAPHDYSVLNDWNQGFHVVEMYWKDVLQYWLSAYKADGFRFDLVKGLGDNNSYGSGTDAYNSSRVERMKRLHGYMKEINPEAYCINENLAGSQEENEMAADGQLNWFNVNNNSCQYAMGISTGSATDQFLASKSGRTAHSTISYAESHDEERMAYKVVNHGANATIKESADVQMRRLGSVAAQMLLTPGAHMIWQFGELGADQTTKNASGNDTGAKRVIWNYLDDTDRLGLHDSYRELCRLRRDNPDLFVEDNITTMMMAQNNWANTCRVLRLANGSKELILVCNPTPSGTTARNVAVSFGTAENSNYTIASQSHGADASFDASKGQVTIAPHNYVVITNSAVAGIESTGNDQKSGIRVYGSDGRIVIDGDYDTAEIYSVSGQRQPSSAVTSGVYIVRVDGRSYKVMVQ